MCARRYVLHGKATYEMVVDTFLVLTPTVHRQQPEICDEKGDSLSEGERMGWDEVRSHTHLKRFRGRDIIQKDNHIRMCYCKHV